MRKTAGSLVTAMIFAGILALLTVMPTAAVFATSPATPSNLTPDEDQVAYEVEVDNDWPLVGDEVPVRLLAIGKNIDDVDSSTWYSEDPSIVRITPLDGKGLNATMSALRAGVTRIYANVVYQDGHYGRWEAGKFYKEIHVTSGSSSASMSVSSGRPSVGSSASGSGTAGSGKSGSSAAGGGTRLPAPFPAGGVYPDSEDAEAPVPLPAATPVETGSDGICRLGGAVIAQPPENYPEEIRAGLITSGTWITTDRGYRQLDTADTGILKDSWALVSDALSENPAGNASLFRFDSLGRMVTGWRWIAGEDGAYRCYYFNEEEGPLYGALLMDGTTPDGFTVDGTGAWTEDGTPVTK